MNDVPVIDLGNHPNTEEAHESSLLVRSVAEACSTVGFFQVVNHGISESLIQDFRSQCRAYFTELPPSAKDRQRRRGTNARGYFDDELTKRRRDWKEALDVGVPGSRDWSLADNDPRNACLDGFNQLPDDGESGLPGFRSTVVRYFEACAELSHRIATLMQAGILGSDNVNRDSNGGGGGCGGGCEEDGDSDGIRIVGDLKRKHTSYLRVNYYPIYSPPPEGEDAPDPSSSSSPAPLGISPHCDAGFLTVLLQDDNCHSLQVVDKNGEWRTVTPVPGSLTINTGVMAQIWSNGRYKAPLHRVLTNSTSVRYSAPFFYNPGYDAYIRPVIIQNNGSAENAPSATTTVPRYHPCLWGYFRAVRFAGDLTDLGVEIQIEDFEIDGSNTSTGKDNDGDNNQAAAGAKNKHLERQARFARLARYDQPFSVEAFRDLLTG